MRIIDKYIGKQLLGTVILVLFALLVLDLFFYLINELRHLGKGSYNLTTAMNFVAFTIPRKLYVLFPWAALIGTLLSLGSLSEQSEIIIMRTSTMSLYDISISVIKAIIPIIIFMLILGEIIMPYTENIAQKIKITALSGGQMITSNKGAWIKNKNNFVHVSEIKGKEELSGITKYEINKGQVDSISYAKKAVLNDNLWEIHDIIGTKFLSNKIESANLNFMLEDSLLDLEILQTKLVKHLERLGINKLWSVMSSSASNDLNITDYELAFWKKVMYPFSILVMVLIAIPFVFGPLRNSSKGVRLLIGIILGFVFHVINMISAPIMIVYSMPIALATILPVLIFFLISCFMIYRI